MGSSPSSASSTSSTVRCPEWAWPRDVQRTSNGKRPCRRCSSASVNSDQISLRPDLPASVTKSIQLVTDELPAIRGPLLTNGLSEQFLVEDGAASAKCRRPPTIRRVQRETLSHGRPPGLR